MTTKEARKILGKQAIGVSDTELERDIEVAELFKNLFFNMLKNDKNIKEPRKSSPNMP